MVETAKDKKRRKILVTGSSGMLGVDLCQELSKECDVVGLDVSELSAISYQLSAFIQCDITEKSNLVKAITSVKPDIIVHAAAWTDVDGCENNPDKARYINVDGTKNIAHSASNLNIPLIYISTDFVFDGEKDRPYKENDKTNPINVYGRSKLEGEKIVSSLGKYIILRTSWLYGANGKNFVDTILEKTKKEKTLSIVDDQIGSPTYTRDLAKAIRRLLDSVIGYRLSVIGKLTPNTEHRTPKWGIYHVSNKGEISWFDYAREILKLADINDAKVSPIKSTELDRPAKRPSYSALDNAKFEETFDFTMRTWQEALAEYISEKI